MTQIVPRAVGKIEQVPFRLTLEKLPGDRVQTGWISVSGVEFRAWAQRGHVEQAVDALAAELARHLNITRDDVDVNEMEDHASIRGERRFRLIAHYAGKPAAATDGIAAWRQWQNSSVPKPVPQLPDYIDI